VRPPDAGADDRQTVRERAAAAIGKRSIQEVYMVRVALLARLEAKPGKVSAVEALLKDALPLANAETATTVWFALKIGPSTFGIFDAFADESGRQAHLAGQIAAALMAKAPELLSQPPTIERVDVLAAKL
jgi:quinol monooxygenase YgiN